MSEEVTYYSDGAIRVTNARAVLGGKTYAMANITSVTMGKIPANRTAGIVIALAGLVIASCAGCPAVFALSSSGSDTTVFWVASVGVGLLGLLALAAGIAVAAGAQPSYVVRLGSASGETNALVSRDQEYIQKIVSALNEAIIRRG